MFGPKVLLGALNGQASPVETQGIRCQYVDYELDANAEATHPRPNGMSTLFVYVYEGSGTFCGTSAKKGEVLRLSSSGDVHVKASSRLGFMLLAGEPLREPIVQHGPFVMSTQDQIMQAFQDYHSGNFLAEGARTSSTRRARPLPTKDAWGRR